MAAAVVGCGAPVPAAELGPVPAMAAITPPALAPPDPVAYDPGAELTRLARADAVGHLEETRREQRVGAVEAAVRARHVATPSPLSHAYFDPSPFCGRG